MTGWSAGPGPGRGEGRGTYYARCYGGRMVATEGFQIYRGTQAQQNAAGGWPIDGQARRCPGGALDGITPHRALHRAAPSDLLPMQSIEAATCCFCCQN